MAEDHCTRTCTFSDCAHPVKARDLCGGHYAQRARGETMRPLRYRRDKPKKPCSFDSCGRAAKSKGLCSAHYLQVWSGGELRPLRVGKLDPDVHCGFEGCERPAASSGLCQGHRRQQITKGELTAIRPSRGRRGDGWVSRQGYKYFKNSTHPNRMGSGYIAEHTLVMSEFLGRPLREGENVHHINGVRDDNRIENLELWNTSQPAGQRVEDKVAWAKEILGLYEPGALR